MQKYNMDHGVCRLVPAGDTEFAKDAAFGYKASNLREVKIFLWLFKMGNRLYKLLTLVDFS